MNESSKSRRVETLAEFWRRGHPAVGRERSCRFGNSDNREGLAEAFVLFMAS